MIIRIIRIIRIEKKIRIGCCCGVLPPISLLSQPFLSLSPKLFSPLLLLTFLFISLFLFHIVACSSFPLIFPDLFSPLLSFTSSLLSLFLFPLLASSLLSHLACLNSLFLSSLARLFVPLFTFPLSALPVPRVQELTLASLTYPLLGALRAAIGIKYSFISFITFILIRLSLNKSLIEPYY